MKIVQAGSYIVDTTINLILTFVPLTNAMFRKKGDIGIFS